MLGEKIYIGNKEIARAYHKGKVVYPNPVKDGLVLWFDAKGRTNGDKYKNVWKDLSGNGNHGELMNFGYTEDSGWVDGGLRFDGVDDYVQLPDLVLNPDNFTFQIDNKIRAFNGDKIITENGDEWGRNLLKDSQNGVKLFSNNVHTYPILYVQHDGYSEVRRIEPYTQDMLSTFTLSFYEKQDGETYTESVEVMTKGESCHVGLSRPVATHFLLESEEWRKIYRTFEATGDGEVRVQGIYSNDIPLNQPLYYKNYKVEKGSTATPWTPAPEDITETNIINHATPFVENNTIHSLKLYNRALTDEEILQNYQAER